MYVMIWPAEDFPLEKKSPKKKTKGTKYKPLPPANSNLKKQPKQLKKQRNS